MRILLLATTVALMIMPSVASAQNGRAVKAWYHVRSGREIKAVQAMTIEVNHGKDRARVMVDGRAVQLRGNVVAISYGGTGPEPMPYGGRSGSTSASGGDFGGGGHTNTEVEVVVDGDGTSHTKTTTTRTETDGSQTTTTTTTTTTPGGETTTTTSTSKS